MGNNRVNVAKGMRFHHGQSLVILAKQVFYYERSCFSMGGVSLFSSGDMWVYQFSQQAGLDYPGGWGAK